MTKKLILLLTASILVCNISVFAASAYKPILQANFDDLTQWTGVGGNGGTGTYSSPNGVGSLYADWKANTAFTAAPAPSPTSKLEGTNFNNGSDTDNALLVDFVSGSNSNYFFSHSVSAATDLYGTLKLTFNVYIDESSGSSHSMFQADLRTSTSGSLYSTLFAIRNRSANALQIYHTNSSTYKSMAYELDRWYNFEFIIDTTTKTFSFYLDGQADPALTNVPLPNQKMYFSGDPNTEYDGAFLFNQLRFYSNQSNVTGSKYYVDDIYFAKEVGDINPIFISTIHASGEENTMQVDVPKDIRQIVVEFPYDMDTQSLERFTSLTYGDKTMPITGLFDSTTKRYTIMLGRAAVPSTEYKLTFKKGVKTSQNQELDKDKGVVLDIPYTISFQTETVDFAIGEIFFTNSEDTDDRTESLTSSTVYANASLMYTNLMAKPQDVTLFAVVYKKTPYGMLMLKTDMYKETFAVPDSSELETYDMRLAVDLSDISDVESCCVAVFVWDNVEDKNAMTEALLLEHGDE